MTGTAPQTGHRDSRWVTVWPTGRHSIATDPASGPLAPPGAAVISPAVAAHAIAVYSRPGDTICDPDCEPGAVVTEAVHAHRHAIGITTDPGRWETARASLTLAKARGARGDGMILDRLPDRESWTGLGPVDLVLTAIGPPDPAGPAGDRLREQLATYRDPLRHGGHLVVITAYHIAGGMDLASQVAVAGRDTGWRPMQRAVALTAVPYTRDLGTDRPPPRARAYPVHQDVIVFRLDGRRAHDPRPPGPPPARAALGSSPHSAA
ncbi:SAM-dependent methyltransferase [Frankia sp. CcI49]|uniref:SAM-dependent methyltransferase n=1 Tax=Frankia sp. CcI49 TaxID=1745382 RepID=UPI0009781ED0|nr:SAM-dependent methyltransferase [Frankia sp. CcI49]ONH52940.1 SAM-dependent methyltransferase [Frankia sp. CcI49]